MSVGNTHVIYVYFTAPMLKDAYLMHFCKRGVSQSYLTRTQGRIPEVN